jgi:hypothetical protein
MFCDHLFIFCVSFWSTVLNGSSCSSYEIGTTDSPLQLQSIHSFCMCFVVKSFRVALPETWCRIRFTEGFKAKICHSLLSRIIYSANGTALYCIFVGSILLILAACGLYIKTVCPQQTCGLYIKTVCPQQTCGLYIKTVCPQQTCGLYFKTVCPKQTVTAVIFLLCSRLIIRSTRASSGMLLLSWTLWQCTCSS